MHAVGSTRLGALSRPQDGSPCSAFWRRRSWRSRSARTSPWRSDATSWMRRGEGCKQPSRRSSRRSRHSTAVSSIQPTSTALTTLSIERCWMPIACGSSSGPWTGSSSTRMLTNSSGSRSPMSSGGCRRPRPLGWWPTSPSLGIQSTSSNDTLVASWSSTCPSRTRTAVRRRSLRSTKTSASSRRRWTGSHGRPGWPSGQASRCCSCSSSSS